MLQDDEVIPPEDPKINNLGSQEPLTASAPVALGSPGKESQEEDLDTYEQWSACLPDDVWAKFSSRPGLKRTINSSHEVVYQIKMSENAEGPEALEVHQKDP